MSNPSATVGNGCSLEDCYTNIFTLSEFRDIQYCKYSYSQVNCNSLSSSAGDNPLLKVYTRCLEKGLLCSWNRARRSQDNSANDSAFTKPHHFTSFDLELWVFWFGEKAPPLLASNLPPGVKESMRGGWQNGLQYDSRTAFFKALLGVIERCFLDKDYVRMGKWFVPCSKTLKAGSSAMNMEYSLHYNFFLHGENIVCATLDIRHLPPIRHLLPSDLHALNRKGPNARLPVILSPYGINAQLCSTALLHPQSQDQEELRLRELHRRWCEFYNLPSASGQTSKTSDRQDESTSFGINTHSFDANGQPRVDVNDVSKLPPMVEVIIASHRSFYPSFLVMLSLEPNQNNSFSVNGVTSYLPESSGLLKANQTMESVHSHIQKTKPPLDHPLSNSVSNSTFPISTEKKFRSSGFDFNSIIPEEIHPLHKLRYKTRERQESCVNQLLTNRSHERTLQDSLVIRKANFYAKSIPESNENYFSSNVLLDPSAPVHCRCRRHNRRGEKRRRGTQSRLYSSLITSQKLRLRSDHESAGHLLGNDIDADNPILEETDNGITYVDMESLCSRLHSPPPACAPFPCETADPTMPTLSPQQAIPNCGAHQQATGREPNLSSGLDSDEPSKSEFLSPVVDKSVPLANVQAYSPLPENRNDLDSYHSHTSPNPDAQMPFTAYQVVTSKPYLQPVNYEIISTNANMGRAASPGVNKSRSTKASSLSVFSAQHPTRNWLWKQCSENMMGHPPSETFNASNNRKRSVNALDNDFWYDNCFSEPISPLNIELGIESSRRPGVFPAPFSNHFQSDSETKVSPIMDTANHLSLKLLRMESMNNECSEEDSSIRNHHFSRGSKTPYFQIVSKPNNGVNVIRPTTEIAHMLPTPPSNESMLSPAVISATVGDNHATGFYHGIGTATSNGSGMTHGGDCFPLCASQQPLCSESQEAVLQSYFGLSITSDKNEEASQEWSFLKLTRSQRCIGQNYKNSNVPIHEFFSTHSLPRMDRFLNSHSLPPPFSSNTYEPSLLDNVSHHHNHPLTLYCVATGSPSKSGSLLKPVNSHQSALPAPLLYSSSQQMTFPFYGGSHPSPRLWQHLPNNSNSCVSFISPLVQQFPGSYSSYSATPTVIHQPLSIDRASASLTPTPSSHRGIITGGNFSVPFTNQTSQLALTGGGGMLSSVGIAGAFHRNSSIFREADSLWLITLLSDSLLNIVKDHNFDSCCNICECSRSALGSEVGLYVAYHPPISESQTQQMSHMSKLRMPSNSSNQALISSAGCKCAFSAVANRRRATISNLFYEDEVDITGVRHDRRNEHKVSLWSRFLSHDELLSTNQHASFYPSLPNATQLHMMFAGSGLVTGIFDEFVVRTLLQLHRYEQTIVMTMRKRLFTGSNDGVVSHCFMNAMNSQSYLGEVAQPNILEYQDGSEWCLLALEQTTLTSDGTVQPYNDEQSHENSSRIGLNDDRNYQVLSKLFHRITPADIPDSYSDQIRLLKTIRPWLQDALGATRSMEYAFTVEGPLTWAGFHKLAGRGHSETCGPQPVAQLQMCIAQDPYSLLGSTQGVNSLSDVTGTGVPLIQPIAKVASSSSFKGQSPLNELLRLNSTSSSCGSLSAHESAWMPSLNMQNTSIIIPSQSATVPFSASENNENETCGVVISPYALGLWDHLNLAPYSKAKHVICFLLAPNDTTVLYQCKNYLQQLKQTYERCHLGRFVLLEQNDLTSPLTGLAELPTSDHSAGVFPVDCQASDVLCNVMINNPPATATLDTVSKLLQTYVDAVQSEVMKFSRKPCNNIDGYDSITLAVENYFKKPQLDFMSIVNGYHKLTSQAKKLVSLFPYSERNDERVLTSAYSFNEITTERDFSESYLSIFLVNPFSLAVDHNCALVGKDAHAPLARLVMQSMMTCIKKCRDSLPAYWRDRCSIQLIPVNELLPTASSHLSASHAFQQDRLLLMALATYSAIERVIAPSVSNSNKSLTQVGPAAERERCISSYKQNGLSFAKKVSAPLYILANSVYRSLVSGLSGISAPQTAHLSGSDNTYYLLSHSTQTENVLLVSYCLSSNLHWLLAVCTDEVGSFLKHTTINIWIPEMHKRRKASARKHALNKLWEWIISVVACTTQAWRLVIGRIGRIGHGELIGLEGLTSRKHLLRSNNRLRCALKHPRNNDLGDCSHCPRILSACVTCLELHPSLRIYTGAVQQEERASSALPITTPRDASVTHILVFPTSTSISAQQDADMPGCSTDHSLPDIFDFDLLEQTDDFNFTDILRDTFFFDSASNNGPSNGLDFNFEPPTDGNRMSGHSSLLNSNSLLEMPSQLGTGVGVSNSNHPMFFDSNCHVDNSCNDRSNHSHAGPTARGLETRDADCGTEPDPQTEGNTLMQQPLAMGYYVSTAPTGPLPSWLWCGHSSEDPFQETAANDPSGNIQSTNCFLAALHLQTTLVCTNGSAEAGPKGTVTMSQNEGSVINPLNPTLPSHPLDSSTTCDVLRYVLETYNALSWLTLDPIRRERRTCLPVHMLSLLQLYHAQNAFL